MRASAGRGPIRLELPGLLLSLLLPAWAGEAAEGLHEVGRQVVQQYLEAPDAAGRATAAARLEALGQPGLQHFRDFLQLEERRMPAERWEGPWSFGVESLIGNAYLQLPATAPPEGAPVVVVLLPDQLTDQEAAEYLELHLGTTLWDAGFVVAVPRPFKLDSGYTRRVDPSRPAYVRWTGGSGELVPYLLATLGRTLPVDTGRVHLLGLASGGDGALWVAARYADRLASVAVVDGHFTGRHVLHQASNLASLQVLAGYGLVTREEMQEQTRTVGGPDQVGLTEILRSVGITLQLEPAVVTEEGRLAVEALAGWYAPHRRIPPCRVVHWFCDRPGYGGFQWLEITRCDSSASMTVAVEPRDNRIEVQALSDVQAFTLHLDPRNHDPARPLEVTYQGEVIYSGRPRPRALHLLESWRRWGDPTRLHGARVELELR